MVELTSVIVGGLLAVFGGGASQFFLHRAKEISDKKKVRAEKFEQLLTAIFAHKHWLQRASNVRVFGKETDMSEAPIAKALAITTAYLPELGKAVSDLETASLNYEVWMLDAARKRIAGEEKFLEGQGDAYKAYLLESVALMTEVVKFQKEKLS